MQDILSFVTDLQAAYQQQADEFKAIVQEPKRVQARNFERYVIELYKYLDKTDRTDAEKALYKLVYSFVADYDGAYL